jgi:hypothetical protein
MTSLGPGTKTPPKHNQQGRRTIHKTKQNTSKTRQELTSTKTTQRHTSPANHLRQIPQRAHTGQTGGAWVARDEQNPQVNSSKSNSRSPNSLHGFEQDFGGSRNTSWALHSQVMVYQNLLNQEESEDFRQEHHKPLNNKNPQNRAHFLTDLGGESKGKEPRRVHAYIPQQIIERKALKSLREKHQKRL